MDRRPARDQAIIGRSTPARDRLGALGGVEAELAGERASALGRAGDRLEHALDAWRRLAGAPGASDAELTAALDAVARATYALLVQRDCAGFRTDNLGWLRRHYEIPEAAIRRIGRRSAR